LDEPARSSVNWLQERRLGRSSATRGAVLITTSGTNRLIRVGLLAIVGLLVIAVGIATVADSHPAAAAGRYRAVKTAAIGTWVTSWAAGLQAATPTMFAISGVDDKTVRNIVFTSAGGDALRLDLTNVFGAAPLQVGHVTVAQTGPGATVVPGTIHDVTFGGSPSFQIPAGGQLLSDPVAMSVQPLAELTVSLYLPGRSGAISFHSDGQQVNWVSAAGDHATDENGNAFTTQMGSWLYLSQVLVRSSAAEGTVVAFGDSITDGYQSMMGANGRWPNDLARRLDSVDGPRLSVADEGISGNRVLNDSAFFGPSALARFRRDALDVPGVRDIILLEGINDIGFSANLPHPGLDVSAAEIIAGYKRLIAEAHAAGVRIFGATLLPYQGADYYTAAGEAKREAVNAWIRTSGAFDGVIDFDHVMRDPVDPLALNPGYDSGDHLHPDNAGYQAMADAINLPLLLRR
jgi:lysophospholipase L1-like esterase